MNLLPLSPDQGQPIEKAQSAFSQPAGHKRIEAETSGNVENSVAHPPDVKNGTADTVGSAGGEEGITKSDDASDYHIAGLDTTFDGIAIYGGAADRGPASRHHLGNTFDLGCRYAAELVDGTDLGSFPNRNAAVVAVLAAARSRS